MQILLSILLIYNIAVHFWFVIFEIFLWRSKFAEKNFGLTPQLAKDTSSLAANQGLYNGFLAAGLLWGMTATNPELGMSLKMYFVGCMAVAGIFGYLTAKKIIIMFMQGIPAILCLILLFTLK